MLLHSIVHNCCLFLLIILLFRSFIYLFRFIIMITGSLSAHQSNPLGFLCLPYSCSFSYDHSQMMPVMSWMSLRKGLKCLLTGSPLLEKLSLISLPCPLNSVIQNVLHDGNWERCLPAGAADLPPMPLGQLQHIDLLRTDMEITTVESLIQRSKTLKFVDLSYCWKIRQTEWMHCKTLNKVKVVWM